MEKTVLFGLFMAMMGVSAAQVHTYGLNHMPAYYHLENWPDSSMFTCIHTYFSSGDTVVWGERELHIGVPFCVYGARPALSLYNYDFWNTPNIRDFAVGKHSDSAISVAGIAFLYPHSKWNRTTQSFEIIRNEWLSHGYEQLKLQLLDTGMNVLAEGSSLLADSIGKPVFQIDAGVGYNEVCTVNEYMYCDNGQYGALTFDIYEAMFPTPITVSDSFYLALHFDSNTQGDDKTFYSVPVPGIYERLSRNDNTGLVYYDTYDFPRMKWLAKGRYRYNRMDYGVIYYDTIDDDSWFTTDICEEKHGYMLIFPIVETPCLSPTGMRWSPAGGGNVHLRWDSGEWDTEWEVSYGLSGTAPDDGTVLSATTPSARLGGIGTDTHYVAYVRTKCVVRDTVWSDWSDSVSIFISTQGIVDAEGSEDIVLSSNPASATVRLTSGTPLTDIEVYTAKGVFYKRLPATGYEAVLDVATWPRGTYLLRITTPLGPVTKKLLVQ